MVFWSWDLGGGGGQLINSDVIVGLADPPSIPWFLFLTEGWIFKTWIYYSDFPKVTMLENGAAETAQVVKGLPRDHEDSSSDAQNKCLQAQ